MKRHTCITRNWSILLLLALMVSFSSCNKKLFKKKSKGAEPVATSTAEPNSMNNPVDEAEEEPIEPMEEVEETAPAPRKLSKEQQLDNYFGAIANASSTSSANASIAEALDMFSDTEAPVLIVIYHDGAQPSYDEPTTINKYLNYLKDTKNDKAEVEEIVYDEMGQIKELVLKK